MRPRSLRSRLTFAYTAALVIGLVVFAVVSDVLLDRAFKVMVDQRLRSTAEAAAAIVDTTARGGYLNASDTRQFERIIGVKLDGALIRSDGTILISSAEAVPPEVMAFACDWRTRTRLAALTPYAQGGDTLRATHAPVLRGAAVTGIAVVWLWSCAVRQFAPNAP